MRGPCSRDGPVRSTSDQSRIVAPGLKKKVKGVSLSDVLQVPPKLPSKAPAHICGPDLRGHVVTNFGDEQVGTNIRVSSRWLLGIQKPSLVVLPFWLLVPWH